MELIRTKVGPYVIERPLGRGGMGAVFLAKHEELGRTVALKILDATAAAGDPSALQRFKREAEVAMTVIHPNLVRVWDYGVVEGSTYLAMECVSGRSLRDVLDEEAPVPCARAFSFVREILSALEALHGAGVTHRDLKPQNVMLEDAAPGGGRIRVLDMGLVQIVDRTVLTREGMMVGSPRYLPPEMIEDSLADARSDLYQVGLILYEALAAKPAFEGKHIPSLLADIVTKAPPPIEIAGPDADRAQEFLKRTLAKDRTQRFASATEALAFLAPRARPSQKVKSAVLAPASGSSSASSSSSTRRILPLALALSSVLALCGLLLAHHLTSSLPPASPPSSPSTSTLTPTLTSTSTLLASLTTSLAPFTDPALIDSLSELHTTSTPRPTVIASASSRVEALLQSSDLPRLARLYRASPSALSSPDLAPPARSELVKRIGDLVDLAEALRATTGRDAGLPVADLSPPVSLPPSAVPWAAFLFADGAVPADLAAFPHLVREGPPARFAPSGGNFLNQVSESGRRYIRERELPAPVPACREVYLAYRLSGGSPTEKLAVRFLTADAKPVPMPQAELRAGEGCVRLDARLFVGPTVHFVVAFTHRQVRAIPSGLTVERLALYVVR